MLTISQAADGSYTVLKVLGVTKAYLGKTGDALELLTPTNLPSAMNAGGSAPLYACRAWVNFNGTGTIAIRGSGNVSSITDNGVGDYRVNFTVAMPDANYVVDVISSNAAGTGTHTRLASTSDSKTDPTTAGYGLLHTDGPAGDPLFVMTSVIR